MNPEPFTKDLPTEAAEESPNLFAELFAGAAAGWQRLRRFGWRGPTPARRAHPRHNARTLAPHEHPPKRITLGVVRHRARQAAKRTAQMPCPRCSVDLIAFGGLLKACPSCKGGIRWNNVIKAYTKRARGHAERHPRKDHRIGVAA